MKKVLALIMAAILIVSLAACGSKNGNSSESGDSGDTSSASGEKIKFDFYHGVGGQMAEILQSYVDEFNASQDKYECNAVYYASYSEAFTAYQAALAAGEPPAMILGGVDLAEARKGIFADLTTLIEEDSEFNLDDYVDAYVEQCKVDGKVCMLPFYGTSWMIFYDKNVLAENGIDPDVAFASWENLEEMARKLTKKDANGEVTYWGFEPMYGVNNMYDAALSLGGRVLSEDGKTVLINDEKWVKAWDMFRKWIYEDEIMTIHYGGQGWEYWYKTIDDVLEGRAAGFIGSAGDLKTLDWDKVDAHVLPGWNDIGPATPELSCIKVAINATSSPEEQKAAFEFYKFFTSAAKGADWSMQTGYIPAIKTAMDDPTFKEYLETAPYMEVALESVLTGLPPYDDVTGGMIWDELSIACDKVMIENIPAQEALDEAAKNIQEELDKYYAK